uniref:Uncharacterized protein n=1 Tax=candidate division CPR3 bacterium TaxID=2268181 RepID=A0A7C4M1E4_UNCC3
MLSSEKCPYCGSIKDKEEEFCVKCRSIKKDLTNGIIKDIRGHSFITPGGNMISVISGLIWGKLNVVDINSREIMKMALKDVVFIHTHRDRKFNSCVMAVSGMESEKGFIYCVECGDGFDIPSYLFSKKTPAGVIIKYLVGKWKEENNS